MLLYVLLPTGSTVSLRNLDATTSLGDFKAQLELSSGFADGTFSLMFNKIQLSMKEEQSIFFCDVYSGAVLRLVENSDVGDVISTICEQDPDAVWQACLHDDVRSDTLNIGKAFIAACICVNVGLKTTLNQLMNAGKSANMINRSLHVRVSSRFRRFCKGQYFI